MPRQSRETQARRRILIRFMLELHALIRESNFPHDEAMVAMAIRLGQYEGRPMDVSDIAGATGLPRSSVSRHLVALRKKGMVRSVKAGKRTVQHLPLSSEPEEVTRFYREFERLIVQASMNVSKMDTSTVDKDE